MGCGWLADEDQFQLLENLVIQSLTCYLSASCKARSLGGADPVPRSYTLPHSNRDETIMDRTFKLTLSLILVVVISGCRRDVHFDKYQIEVAGLNTETAAQLERDFREAGYEVEKVKVIKRLGIEPGHPDLDNIYMISGDSFSTRDLKRINRLILNKKRKDPLELTGTTAAQAFRPFEVGGHANVELRFRLEVGDRVYLKEGFGPDAEPIISIDKSGLGVPSFDYPRRFGDEYVDIVIVGEDYDKRVPPDFYTRIDLVFPYDWHRRPWFPWYVKVWRFITAPFGGSDDSFR